MTAVPNLFLNGSIAHIQIENVKIENPERIRTKAAFRAAAVRTHRRRPHDQDEMKLCRSLESDEDFRA